MTGWNFGQNRTTLPFGPDVSRLLWHRHTLMDFPCVVSQCSPFSCFQLSLYTVTVVMVTVALLLNLRSPSGLTPLVSQAHVEQNTEPLGSVARSGCSTYDFDMFHTLSQGTKRKYCVFGRTLHLEATQIGS